jgi:hypothetical protein
VSIRCSRRAERFLQLPAQALCSEAPRYPQPYNYKCAALAEDRSLAFLRRGWINFDLVFLEASDRFRFRLPMLRFESESRFALRPRNAFLTRAMISSLVWFISGLSRGRSRSSCRTMILPRLDGRRFKPTAKSFFEGPDKKQNRSIQTQKPEQLRGCERRSATRLGEPNKCACVTN